MTAVLTASALTLVLAALAVALVPGAWHAPGFGLVLAGTFAVLCLGMVVAEAVVAIVLRLLARR